MSTIIVHSKFKITTPLVEATVNEALGYFCQSVIIAFFSNSTVLNFHP